MASAPRVAGTDTQWIVGVVLPLLFAGSLVYALGTAMIGWGNTLNDRHSFRQSQTATTAYWMIDEPFRLAYETPVLGKPWAVPLEFPLYQWIVARIVGLCGTPLDQTGRFVSLVFFFLTTIPLLRIVRSAGVPRTLAWVPATLFVVSPFYLFWGRTFMIELAATFLGMSYLCAALEARRGVATPWSALAIVAGSLAALVKITTFGVFLVACAGIACFEAWREWRVRSERPHAMRSIALWLAIPLIPTLVGVGWAHWSAGVRALNPIAGPYLTGAPASEWVYGTWAQKLSPQVWTVIIDRFVELVGYPPLAWLLLGAALAITLVAPRRWKETTACFACYLAGPAVFTNVYFVHDYYMNANGVFLIMALGFAIVGLLEHATTHRAGWCFFGLALCAAVAGHRVMHQPRQTIENAEILEAARYIQSATADDSVIVCVGQDWSPLVAYYARRRALMIPMDRNMDPLLVERALANLKGEKVSALVVVEPTAYSVPQIKRQMAEAGFDVPTLSVTGLPFR